MSLHADTTILTTAGVKTIKELVNQPFTAIIDQDTFPCHLGAQSDGKKDLYLLRAISGQSVVTTFDHLFFTKDRLFKPIQEFRPREKITLSLPRTSFSGKIEHHAASATDIHPHFEFYSSDFYIEFFKKLWQTYGYISNNQYKNLVIFDISLRPHTPMLMRMMQRLGIQASPQFSHGANGIVLYSKKDINNFNRIVLNQDLEYIPKSSVVAFKSLEYFDTAYTFSCDIAGVRAYDANCFYVGDST